jgi:Translin family
VEIYLAAAGDHLPTICPCSTVNISGSQIQSAVFTAALMEYLSTGALISLPYASEILGSKNRPFSVSIHPDIIIGLAVKEEWKDRLYLQAEDYLLGLISLVNELVSSAVISFSLCLTLCGSHDTA